MGLLCGWRIMRYEVNENRRSKWGCFSMIVSYFCVLLNRKDMIWVKYGVAVRVPCIQSLTTMNGTQKLSCAGLRLCRRWGKPGSITSWEGGGAEFWHKPESKMKEERLRENQSKFQQLGHYRPGSSLWILTASRRMRVFPKCTPFLRMTPCKLGAWGDQLWWTSSYLHRCYLDMLWQDEGKQYSGGCHFLLSRIQKGSQTVTGRVDFANGDASTDLNRMYTSIRTRGCLRGNGWSTGYLVPFVGSFRSPNWRRAWSSMMQVYMLFSELERWLRWKDKKR